jgi:hypothetical protein
LILTGEIRRGRAALRLRGFISLVGDVGDLIPESQSITFR